MTTMTEKQYWAAIHAADTIDAKLDILFSEDIEIIEEDMVE